MEIKPEVVFVETSTHTYSLSEEGFGYNYGLLKKFIEPRVSWNTFVMMMMMICPRSFY